jgi:hypothetical protein
MTSWAVAAANWAIIRWPDITLLDAGGGAVNRCSALLRTVVRVSSTSSILSSLEMGPHTPSFTQRFTPENGLFTLFSMRAAIVLFSVPLSTVTHHLLREES